MFNKYALKHITLKNKQTFKTFFAFQFQALHRKIWISTQDVVSWFIFSKELTARLFKPVAGNSPPLQWSYLAALRLRVFPHHFTWGVSLSCYSCIVYIKNNNTEVVTFEYSHVISFLKLVHSMNRTDSHTCPLRW